MKKGRYVSRPFFFALRCVMRYDDVWAFGNVALLSGRCFIIRAGHLGAGSCTLFAIKIVSRMSNFDEKPYLYRQNTTKNL